MFASDHGLRARSLTNVVVVVDDDVRAFVRSYIRRYVRALSASTKRDRRVCVRACVCVAKEGREKRKGEGKGDGDNARVERYSVRCVCARDLYKKKTRCEKEERNVGGGRKYSDIKSAGEKERERKRE